MRNQSPKNQIGSRVAILGLVFTMFSFSKTDAQVISGGVLAPDPGFGETFYLKENARTRKPVPYTHEREADIMWSRRVWRTLDLREKFNLPMYYPEMPLNDRKSLFDVIKNGLLNGEIHAYDNAALDDEFRVKMSLRQMNDVFVQWDSTNQCEDPNNPGTFILCPIKTELTSNNVKAYWMKEDWFYDKERGVMDVRIIGLCPMKEKTDPSSGEVIGYVPLFWLYFPELRPLLAHSEVYNTKNDAQRMTLDDLFMKRMFQSYVRKESNVYDRPIAAYANGIDALLESDRIKNEIFMMEHDMWHL